MPETYRPGSICTVQKMGVAISAKSWMAGSSSREIMKSHIQLRSMISAGATGMIISLRGFTASSEKRC